MHSAIRLTGSTRTLSPTLLLVAIVVGALGRGGSRRSGAARRSPPVLDTSRCCKRSWAWCVVRLPLAAARRAKPARPPPRASAGP